MENTLIDGRYLLLEAIGSGGEARVYRARDTATGHEVAARMALRPVTYAPPSTLPFFHPGWVQFHVWGTDPQHGAYQIFELLKGPTLQQLVPYGPLAPDNWRLFVDQSLDAVDALHQAGWIHGDLNAGNFIHSGPTESGWKLIELPFLHFDPPPDRSALFGSILTLSPEQIDGAQADARSDQYALGCLYYYAAAGEFPHHGATHQEIAIERLRFAPTPLAAKAPRLPEAWSAWVMTLLERDPQSRFASISAARHLLRIA
jgi:serine/threonine protein kinase